MKTVFIVNPHSANGDTGKRWGELNGHLGKALSDFSVEFTKEPMHAASLTTRALKSGADCVVAVGGDGTINEVVNGFFENGAVINSKAMLGVLPRGTGGDFRRTFEWDSNFLDAVKRLSTPGARPLDVGLVEYRAHDGSRGRRYFANICSFGVSGVVDQEVNTTSKAFGGAVSFALGSLKALMKYSDRTVRFSLDDGPAQVAKVTTLAVANGKFFGGGMKVAPDADVSDGMFDVTLWSGYGISDFVLKSSSIYNGSHVKWAGTQRFRCKKLVAESDETVLIDCDGEQPGMLPCTMTVLPGALRLKV